MPSLSASCHSIGNSGLTAGGLTAAGEALPPGGEDSVDDGVPSPLPPPVAGGGCGSMPEGTNHTRYIAAKRCAAGAAVGKGREGGSANTGLRTCTACGCTPRLTCCDDIQRTGCSWCVLVEARSPSAAAAGGAVAQASSREAMPAARRKCSHGRGKRVAKSDATALNGEPVDCGDRDGGRGGGGGGVPTRCARWAGRGLTAHTDATSCASLTVNSGDAISLCGTGSRYCSDHCVG